MMQIQENLIAKNRIKANYQMFDDLERRFVIASGALAVSVSSVDLCCVVRKKVKNQTFRKIQKTICGSLK